MFRKHASISTAVSLLEMDAVLCVESLRLLVGQKTNADFERNIATALVATVFKPLSSWF